HEHGDIGEATIEDGLAEQMFPGDLLQRVPPERCQVDVPIEFGAQRDLDEPIRETKGRGLTHVFAVLDLEADEGPQALMSGSTDGHIERRVIAGKCRSAPAWRVFEVYGIN